MILPPPWASMCGTTAWHTRKTPFVLVSRILSHWPSSAVSSGPKCGDEARVVLLQGAIATHGNRVTSASAIRSLRNHALRLVRPKRGG